MTVADDWVCRVEGDHLEPQAEGKFTEQRWGVGREGAIQPCRHVRLVVEHAPRGQHVHETPRADTCEEQRLVKAKTGV